MFLKPANSDMKNGSKKIQKCPLKKFIYSGNWKWHYLKGTRSQIQFLLFPCKLTVLAKFGFVTAKIPPYQKPRIFIFVPLSIFKTWAGYGNNGIQYWRRTDVILLIFVRKRFFVRKSFVGDLNFFISEMKICQNYEMFKKHFRKKGLGISGTKYRGFQNYSSK